MEAENQKLREELNTVKTENMELKERLKKYTAPSRNLDYYHKNKEKIDEYKKEYYQKKKAENQ